MPTHTKAERAKNKRLKDSKKLGGAFKASAKSQAVLDRATEQRAIRRRNRLTSGRVLADIGAPIRTVGRARQAAKDLQAENRRLRAKKKKR